MPSSAMLGEPFDFRRIIARRRDRGGNTAADFETLAKGAATGDIPDYQLSAWLMAAYLNPLDDQETAWLTQSMADSGSRIDLTGLPKPWVDKHSTGGVGDKTTIVLLPLLAACGLTMVKMSGRGLGITGGTVDKLASVPGFRLDLDPEEMKRQAGEIGLALTGQSPSLAPADKTLYALRDATGTVESMPLIVSSILSKKLAGGAETVVLDVKSGSGAFMKDFGQAQMLADGLLRTANLVGLNCRIAITDMSQPIGRTVGNALEVQEALSVLAGEQGRFRDLCLSLAALTLQAVGRAKSDEDARAIAEEALISGRALEKCRSWFKAQGADPGFVDAGCPAELTEITVTATGQRDGWLARLDAGEAGEVVVELGGGRRRKEDAIDPGVGLVCHAQVGDTVSKDQPIVTVHARDTFSAERAIERLTAAISVSDSEVARIPPILKRA